MNTDEHDAGLPARVNELEAEVRRLRARLMAVERLVGVVTQPTRPQVAPAPPPLAVTGPLAAPRAVAPPPWPPVQSAPPPPPPPAPSVVREFLRAMHLLPPGGAGSGEVQMGAWWATRLGALLAVIGVVFFGVHLSIGTPPWVKLTELAVVAVALTFAGNWIERRVERVGRVIEGAGLALIFFAAFAAYAVPAVKVIANFWVAAGVQAAAVAVVFGAAIRRDSPTVATMATLLGFVSAFFSIGEGFDDFALFAALALAVVTVVFFLRDRWVWPLGVAAVLVHVVYAVVVVLVWDGGRLQPTPMLVYGALGANFGVVLASLGFLPRTAGGRVPAAQRWIQALNTSLAVLAGLVATMVVVPDEPWSGYFFGAAAVLVAVAAWAWRALPGDGLFSMFAVKAAALCALGAVTQWGERTLWVALMIEAGVILAAAWRTQRRALFAAAVAAGLVSVGFFLSDAGALRGRMWSGDGATAVVYALAAAAFTAAVLRSWREIPERERPTVQLVGGLGAVPALGMVAALIMETAWGIVGALGVIAALLAIARGLRSLAPLTGGVVMLAGAHVMLYRFDEAPHGAGWLWIGAGLLGAADAATGWCAMRWAGRFPDASDEQRRWPALVFFVLALAALDLGMQQSLPAAVALGLAAVAAAGVAWAGVVAARAVWVEAGIVAGTLAVLWAPLRVPLGASIAGDEWWSLLAAAAGVALLAALGQPGPARAELARSRGKVVGDALAVTGAVLLVRVGAGQVFDVTAMVWFLAAAAVAVFALGLWRRLTPALVAATAWLLMAMAAMLAHDAWLPEASWQALSASLVAALLLAATSAVGHRHAGWLSETQRRAWRVPGAAGAILFVLYVGLVRPAPWASLTSVVWAVGGVAVFVLGLFFRARAHRIAGLLVLALCIPRVFVVDITSPLYRIAAFVVLGVVLVWVGVSYQRFRHLIEEDRTESKPAG